MILEQKQEKKSLSHYMQNLTNLIANVGFTALLKLWLKNLVFKVRKMEFLDIK